MIYIPEGIKYIGDFQNRKVFLDLDYILKYKGSRTFRAELDKTLGKFLILISVALTIVSFLISFLSGQLTIQKYLSPKDLITFLPYISIITLIYGLFLNRNREEFDEDVQFKFDFNNLPQEIRLEKYISFPLLEEIGKSYFKNPETFLLNILDSISRNSRNRYLVEQRLGISYHKFLESSFKHLSLKKVSFDDSFAIFFFNSLNASYRIDSELIDSTTSFFTFLRVFLREVMLDLGITDSEVESLEIWQKNESKKVKYFNLWKKLSQIKPTGSINRSYTSKATPVLNSLSEDLTAVAAKKQFITSIGREGEIAQVFQILQKGNGSNVMLLGEPGVGKTRFIKYIATRMVVEDVPESLQDLRLVSIDLGKILTKSSQIESFKTNLQKIFEEIKMSGNIVLVMEDFAQILNIRDDSKMEVVNLIIGNINEFNLKVIATSTQDDYNKLIRPIKTLASLFDVVQLKEPSSNIALQILIDEVPNLEKKYGLSIQINALKRVVEFSPRFNYERVLPDKGIDLLEECCINARNSGLKHVDISIVDEVLKSKTGINVGNISSEEAEMLKNLEERLHERVVGQDEAIKSIAMAIRRSRSGLGNPNKPVASFLFFGPTGVGKTELAKTLADVYYGSEKLMIRVDMSEYQEESNLSRLIGYTDNRGNFIGGYLTEAVRTRPYSLILLDEVEKANKKVLDLFLQVLDDGFLTDGMGRKIDFTNTMIIMTSNVASREIADLIIKGYKYNEVFKIVSEKLRLEFRVEFLNRFDKVIMFKPLTIFEIKEIVRIVLEKIKSGLLNRGIMIEWNDKTLSELAEVSYNQVYGAREIRRVVQERIEDQLASLIIEGKIKSGIDIKFDGLNISNLTN